MPQRVLLSGWGVPPGSDELLEQRFSQTAPETACIPPNPDHNRGSRAKRGVGPVGRPEGTMQDHSKSLSLVLRSGFAAAVMASAAPVWAQGIPDPSFEI